MALYQCACLQDVLRRTGEGDGEIVHAMATRECKVYDVFVAECRRRQATIFQVNALAAAQFSADLNFAVHLGAFDVDNL